MRGRRFTCSIRCSAVALLLVTTACTIVPERHLDWNEVQAFGGVRVLDPVQLDDGTVQLPILFDASGRTAVTSPPTGLDSLRIARNTEVTLTAYSIGITIVTGAAGDAAGGLHAPPAVLRGLQPGVYEVDYQNRDGSQVPMRTVRLGVDSLAPQRYWSVPDSWFQATIMPGLNARFPAADGFWTPSADDVRRAESRIIDTLDRVARQPDETPPDFASNGRSGRNQEVEKIVRHLSEYRAQFVGLIVGGHKRVYGNFFMTSGDGGGFVVPGGGSALGDDSWVEVMDGGYAFWRIQYDLDDDRCLAFESNGYA